MDHGKWKTSDYEWDGVRLRAWPATAGDGKLCTLPRRVARVYTRATRRSAGPRALRTDDCSLIDRFSGDEALASPSGAGPAAPAAGPAGAGDDDDGPRRSARQQTPRSAAGRAAAPSGRLQLPKGPLACRVRKGAGVSQGAGGSCRLPLLSGFVFSLQTVE